MLYVGWCGGGIGTGGIWCAPGGAERWNAPRGALLYVPPFEAFDGDERGR